MSDLGPMVPCPCNKRGRHNFNAIIPGDDSGDVTLFCEGCGALRRVPVSGALMEGSKDDLTPEQIRAYFG